MAIAMAYFELVVIAKGSCHSPTSATVSSMVANLDCLFAWNF